MTFMNKKKSIFMDGNAIDSDKVNTAEEAIEQVLGGKLTKLSYDSPTSWWDEDYYTVLPQKADNSDFEDWIDGFKNKNIKGVYCGDTVASSDDISVKGRFNFDGDDYYTVTINGDYLRHANGDIFRIKYGEYK